MNYLLVFIFGFLGLNLYSRIKSYFFKKQSEMLNEEDKKLKEKQIEINNEIVDLKKQIEKPIETLTPEQIENFWDKK